MSGRPVGNPPIWAANANMSDPGKPWDGTPTKVAPASGIIAAGHLPNTPPPAERFNWWQNDVAQRLDNVDMIELSGWIEPGDGVGNMQASGAGSGPGFITCATWHYGKRLMHCYSDTRIMSSSDGGYTWGLETSSVGSSFVGIVSQGNPVTGGLTVAAQNLSGVGSVTMNGTALAGWGTFTLAGTSPFTQAVTTDPTSASNFWVCGNTTPSALSPSVWKVNLSNPLSPAVTLLAGGPGVSAFTIIAVGSGNGMAYAFDTGVNRLASFDLGAAAFTTVTAPTSTRINDIVWLPVDGVFLMIDATGYTWTSTTGATGTWVAQTRIAYGLPATINTYAQSATVRGSLIVVPWNDGSTNFLAISGDAGLTWETLPDPIYRHKSVTFAALAQRRVRVVDNRLVVFAPSTTPTNGVYPVYSSRAGRPV